MSIISGPFLVNIMNFITPITLNTSRMSLARVASKEEFVSRVQERSTNFYSLRIHVIGALLAIAVSFYLTFWATHEPLPIIVYLWSGDGWLVLATEIVRLEIVNIASFFGVLFTYRFVFKGLSISSLPFFVTHRHGPTDFLTGTYLLVSAIAIAISIFGVDFEKGSTVGPLSLLDAFYYVVGVVSTAGSNIAPASRASQVLSICFSAITLLLAVFFFGQIEKIRTNRKIHFDAARNELEAAYDKITSLITDSSLDDEEKNRVFAYFLDEFNFDQSEGVSVAEMKMRDGDFAFALKPPAFDRLIAYFRSKVNGAHKSN